MREGTGAYEVESLAVVELGKREEWEARARPALALASVPRDLKASLGLAREEAAERVTRPPALEVGDVFICGFE